MLEQDLRQDPNLEYPHAREGSFRANAKYPETHTPNLNRRQSQGAFTFTEPTNLTAHAKTPSSELGVFP